LLFGLREPEEEDQRKEEDDQRPHDEGASHELLKRCSDDRRVRCPVDFRIVAQIASGQFFDDGLVDSRWAVVHNCLTTQSMSRPFVF